MRIATLIGIAATLVLAACSATSGASSPKPGASAPTVAAGSTVEPSTGDVSPAAQIRRCDESEIDPTDGEQLDAWLSCESVGRQFKSALQQAFHREGIDYTPGDAYVLSGAPGGACSLLKNGVGWDLDQAVSAVEDPHARRLMTIAFVVGIPIYCPKFSAKVR